MNTPVLEPPPTPGTIPLFRVAMAESAAARVAETLASGFVGQGPRVDEFEAALAARIGNPRVVTVNSGTSALHLALHLLRRPGPDGWPGLAPGDEVLTTALTCTATNWPALAQGLRPRWVDVDPATLNLDLDDLEAKLSSRTRAILLVHWGGYPVDLDRVRAIQRRARELFGFAPAVVEDCAHAWASTYRGLPLGNHGNLCAFSFQAIKHLTCGDGGALVGGDDETYRRSRLARWYGIDRDNPRADFRCENDVAEWGFKFHMNDIAASIGLENLRIVDAVVARHRENARYYDARLAGCPGVRLLEYAADRESSYWLYTLLVDRRDDFLRRAAGAGIVASRVHERNDVHTCVREFAAPLPLLDEVARRMVCIPVGWWVDDAQRERVADFIREGW